MRNSLANPAGSFHVARYSMIDSVLSADIVSLTKTYVGSVGWGGATAYVTVRTPSGSRLTAPDLSVTSKPRSSGPGTAPRRTRSTRHDQVPSADPRFAVQAGAGELAGVESVNRTDAMSAPAGSPGFTDSVMPPDARRASSSGPTQTAIGTGVVGEADIGAGPVDAAAVCCAPMAALEGAPDRAGPDDWQAARARA